MKKTLLYLLVFCAALVLGLHFTQIKTVRTAAMPALENFTIEFPEKKQLVGIVDLEQAFKAHPRYRELEGLQEELQRQQADWEQWLREQEQQANVQYQTKLGQTFNTQIREIENQYQARLEARQKLLQEQLTREERARMEEIEKKLRSHEEELGKKLEETIKEREQEMKRKLAAYEGELQEKNKARIVNLKLKLENLPLSDEERQRTSDELGRIDAEQKSLLSIKEAALAGELNEFAKTKQEETLRNLEAYQKTLVQNAGDELEDIRQKLETDFAQELKKQEAKLAAEAKSKQRIISQTRDPKAEAAFRKQVEGEAERREKAVHSLQTQALKLEQEIMADLQRLARDLGKKKRVSQLDIVNPGEVRKWSLWQIDLTSELLEILKREV